MTRNCDVTTLKQQAAGRWPELLANIGGLQSEFLHFDNREGPCPRCGGNTRFRGLDEETGALFCSHCFSRKNGDGISAIQWLTGKSFSEALDTLVEYLDAKPTEQGHVLGWDSVIGLGSANAVAVDGKPASETFATLGDAIAALERRHGPRSATWTYCDAKGEPVGVVVRWNLSDGRKDIRPVSRFSDGWRLAGMPTPRPLYGLPDLAGANRVYVCEGEKAAEAVRSLGLVATTSPHGCNSASKADWRPLAGKEAVILPDADLPGRKYTDAVTALLAKLTPVPVVKVVNLPGLSEHGDAADFVAANAGTNADELRRIVETLAEEASPEWTPSADAAKRIRLPDIQDASDFCAEDIPQPPELIQGVLHRGSKLLLGGGSKGGKTWALMDMALSVAYGIPWLGCETAQSKVLYVNLEIQKSFAQRRLKTLADAKGIVQEAGRLEVWNLRGHATSHMEIFPRILDRIADDDNGLILLDPIYKLYGSMDNENGAREMAALMNSIEHMAVETGAAVAFAAHYSKGNQAAKEAIDRVSGSGVFARDPDSLLNFTQHQTDDCYTVEATLRNFPPMTSFAVRWQFPLFVRDASLDPSELKVPGKSRADKIADTECREAEHCTRLLKALRAAPEGDTARSLKTTTGLNTDRFGKAITTLLQEGRAEGCSIKKHTRMEDGFKSTGK